jgi:hypothetical protein
MKHMTDEQIKAAQEAYEALPFAVRWSDSHFDGTFRFETLDAAYVYIARQWASIRKQVATRPHCGSQLWRSYLETPEGKVSLRYVLLCDDVDSYGYR